MSLPRGTFVRVEMVRWSTRQLRQRGRDCAGLAPVCVNPALRCAWVLRACSGATRSSGPSAVGVRVSLLALVAGVGSGVRA